MGAPPGWGGEGGVSARTVPVGAGVVGTDCQVKQKNKICLLSPPHFFLLFCAVMWFSHDNLTSRRKFPILPRVGAHAPVCSVFFA